MANNQAGGLFQAARGWQYQAGAAGVSPAAAKIVKARVGVILDFPFFGSLLLRLSLREDPSCDTLWTDGRTLGYSPGFVDSLPLDVLKGCLCHEVLHVGLLHQVRRGERAPERWNMAADHAVNLALANVPGLALPAGCLCDSAFSGLSAEEIYSRLPAPAPDPDPDGGGGSDDSGAGADPGGCGEVRDVPGEDGAAAGEADLKAAGAEWAVNVVQAMAAAKAAGSLPGGLARALEGVVNPSVDWRAALRQFVQQTGRADYTWSSPSRRGIWRGVYLPSVKSDEVRPFVVAVDTSGSISAAVLSQFGGEVQALVDETGAPSVSVVYADSAVQAVEEFERGGAPVVLHPVGGGGTDFRPVFDWVEAQGLEPAFLIYLTDLECSSFPDVPGFPVLWARVGAGGSVPPFGDVLQVKA